MQIKVIREKNKRVSSILIGEIKDQSALSSILNSLVRNFFVIKWVCALEEWKIDSILVFK